LLLSLGLNVNVLRHLSSWSHLLTKDLLGNVFGEKTVHGKTTWSLVTLFGLRPHGSDSSHNLVGHFARQRALPLLYILNVCIFILSSGSYNWLLELNVLRSTFVSEETFEECLFAILFFPAILA
jgi:hypothetical protein